MKTFLDILYEMTVNRDFYKSLDKRYNNNYDRDRVSPVKTCINKYIGGNDNVTDGIFYINILGDRNSIENINFKYIKPPLLQKLKSKGLFGKKGITTVTSPNGILLLFVITLPGYESLYKEAGNCFQSMQIRNIVQNTHKEVLDQIDDKYVLMESFKGTAVLISQNLKEYMIYSYRTSKDLPKLSLKDLFDIMLNG